MAEGQLGSSRRHPHIDLVPILDALTVVIFFLVLSSVFIDLTKLTLPPSEISSSVTIANTELPLSPVISGIFQGQNAVQINLSWGGTSPSKLSREVPRKMGRGKATAIEEASRELVKEFLQQHPNEKSIRIWISKEGTYQELISLMDGVRSNIQDLVLVASEETNL